MLKMKDTKYYFYKVNHDYGLAPNPFHGYCTLAVCKSQIRNNKNLNKGDWIIGISGNALGHENRLIFAMCVEEKITFNKYWNDERFINKKPVVNGSLVQMYGDNFYHKEEKNWIQEDSAHSLGDGNTNEKHLKRDVGGNYVLISKEFYYFGDKSPEIPEKSKALLHSLVNFIYKDIPEEIIKEFITLLKGYSLGIHGDPISWKDNISRQGALSWSKQLEWEAELMK